MSTVGDEDGWRPDALLIPAILAGSPTTMRDLSLPDRAWVVVGLTRAGYTAEAIADRLKPCSVRVIRAVLAEPLAHVCARLQEESEAFADEYRMAHGEIERLSRELREATAAGNRYRKQLIDLIDVDPDTPPTFPCGCERTRYNTYVAPKTGKAGCRRHRGAAVARHRAKARQIGGGVIAVGRG